MNQHEAEVDRAIDPDQLDIAALEQSDLYGKWAVRSAQAKSLADKLEWEVELTEAQLQGRCRQEPDKFGIGGAVTETGIKSAVKCHAEYIAAMNRWHAARLEAALLDRAEKAMAQRKGMIEELVKLHGQQYFAGPNVPHNIVAAWEAHRVARDDAGTDAIRQRVRRRARQEGQQ